jgi:cytochrome c oxidase subunit 4
VAVALFSLTALEVALYELTYGGSAGVVGDLRAVFVPVLLLLSAAKFVMVALFYMHLRQDSRLFSGVFAFPLTIAVFIVAALTLLMAYERAFARSG